MTPNPYQVRLVIRRVDAATASETVDDDADKPISYEALWDESDGQTSKPFPLKPPLTREDAANLRWYLEQYSEFVGAGTKVQAHEVETQLSGWGHALFDAVFHTVEGTNVYRNILEAEKSGRPVLLTLGTAEPDVLVQPWELMRDERGPLAFKGVSIRRQLEGSKPIQTLELRLPIRLLLIVSRPTDSGFIDPRTSVRPLLDGLDLLPKGSVEIEFCEPPTLGELEERISQARQQQRPFHIVHFDGHGTYLPTLGVGALCFEKDNRKVDYVTGQRLGDLMARLEIPVAILEACRTAEVSDKPVFGSVAPALLRSGVGSVIAFSHAVHIEAAKLLVERFYRKLVGGLTVGQALSEGRVLLRAKPQRWLTLGPNPPTVNLQDWFVPQLYQVGQDLSLVGEGVDPERGAVVATPVQVNDWNQRLHDFPPEPNYRFHGRAKELWELGRIFEQHNTVVVAGMGGMGKTALSREAAAWWLRLGRFEQAVFCSFEQVRSVDRAVQIFGQAIEGLEFVQRSPTEQRAAAVELFHRQPILWVWDNFESTLEQFEEASEGALDFEDEERAGLRAFYGELTQGQPAGRLLVTCRPAKTGLPRIKKLALKGLARPDSLHLLTAIADFEDIDLERKGYERPKIEKLLADLNDHPLSISLMAPHLGSLKPKAIRKNFADHLDRFTDESADVERNSSLRASLAFSVSRLSPEAQAVLPWLAWFRGGAFEVGIVAFTGLEAAAWGSVRQELESTALVRVEDLPMFKIPFVRFHPTLPYAARADEVPDVDDAEQRFIRVYLGVSQEVYKTLRGQAAAAGMELMAREEANVRAAIDLAFRREDRQVGWRVADTLQTYLQMAGRRRERDGMARQVRSQIPEDAGLDTAACASIWSHARALFAAGQLQEAVGALQGLVARLESDGLADDNDPSLHIGMSYQTLGQILVNARKPQSAISASRLAIERLQTVDGETARVNMSVALGDLANGFRQLGRFDEALEAAEQGVAIDEELNRHRNAASAHGRCAEILGDQGRYVEADQRYEKALDLASQAGDLELQGIVLQQQGTLNLKRGDLDRSVELYELAIRLFQQANDRPNEMRTYDLLAMAEDDRGRFDVAEAWYARGRGMAGALGDQAQLAANAQNVGVLFQRRAEQTETAAEREALLRRAVASIEESLVIKQKRGDQVAAAASHFQLGKLHRMLGDLEMAEEQLPKSLAIYEPLGVPDLWKIYAELAEVAKARGDAEAAAEWAAKRDAKLEELRQLAGESGGQSVLPKKMAAAFMGLAQTVYATRKAGGELPLDTAEALAFLDGQPEPLASVGRFLRAVAEGGSPAVPGGLPDPLPEIFETLLASLT